MYVIQLSPFFKGAFSCSKQETIGKAKQAVSRSKNRITVTISSDVNDLLMYTLRGTNISPKNGTFEDDFPFPKVGYVNFLEGNLSLILFSQSLSQFSLQKPSKQARPPRFWEVYRSLQVQPFGMVEIQEIPRS